MPPSWPLPACRTRPATHTKLAPAPEGSSKACPATDLAVDACGQRPRDARLPDEEEIVQAGDAEHGVVHSVALEAAVAEDLPALQAGEDVLDAGPDLLV